MPGYQEGSVIRTHSPDVDTSIAISGLGLLTPLGESIVEFMEALYQGRHSITPSEDLANVGESKIVNFDAARFATIRGMRVYNRTTRLAICAARLALTDALLETENLNSGELGLVTASTFGHLDTLIEYDRSLVTVGAQQTNPVLMPLGIPSAPGAAIALSFGAKAFSMTVASGGASSTDALGLGARMVREGRAKICIVVGASALCEELSLSAQRAGMLTSVDKFRVFDQHHSGTVFGEAAAALVLERASDVMLRGATPKGMIVGQASAFSPDVSGMESALCRACNGALKDTGIAPGKLTLICSGANGVVESDRIEAGAILALLGDTAGKTPVCAVKGNVGDTVDASGLLQALVAIHCLRTKAAPPIPRLEFPDVPGPRYLEHISEVEDGYALITSTSNTGTASALTLSVNHDC